MGDPYRCNDVFLASNLNDCCRNLAQIPCPALDCIRPRLIAVNNHIGAGKAIQQVGFEIARHCYADKFYKEGGKCSSILVCILYLINEWCSSFGLLGFGAALLCLHCLPADGPNTRRGPYF